MATGTACESAESLTLGTACHLRERERKRGRQQESGEARDRGHKVNSGRAGEVVKYVFPKSDGCSCSKD